MVFLQLFSHFSGQDPGSFLNGEQFRIAGSPQFEFHFALSQTLRGNNRPERDADQVRIAEHEPGFFAAVIEQHFNTELVQIVIKFFRRGADSVLVRVQRAQMDLIRGN